jgi:hypothetical protein
MRSVDFPRTYEGSNNLEIKQKEKRFPRTCVRVVGRVCCPPTYFYFASFVAAGILSRPTAFLIADIFRDVCDVRRQWLRLMPLDLHDIEFFFTCCVLTAVIDAFYDVLLQRLHERLVDRAVQFKRLSFWLLFGRCLIRMSAETLNIVWKRMAFHSPSGEILW